MPILAFGLFVIDFGHCTEACVDLAANAFLIRRMLVLIGRILLVVFVSVNDDLFGVKD